MSTSSMHSLVSHPGSEMKTVSRQLSKKLSISSTLTSSALDASIVMVRE
jgi:hypothetical protein